MEHLRAGCGKSMQPGCLSEPVTAIAGLPSDATLAAGSDFFAQPDGSVRSAVNFWQSARHSISQIKASTAM
jgi:hypothetical protein